VPAANTRSSSAVTVIGAIFIVAQDVHDPLVMNRYVQQANDIKKAFGVNINMLTVNDVIDCAKKKK
jgi:uncharacterized membrane protein